MGSGRFLFKGCGDGKRPVDIPVFLGGVDDLKTIRFRVGPVRSRQKRGLGDAVDRGQGKSLADGQEHTLVRLGQAAGDVGIGDGGVEAVGRFLTFIIGRGLEDHTVDQGRPVFAQKAVQVGEFHIQEGQGRVDEKASAIVKKSLQVSGLFFVKIRGQPGDQQDSGVFGDRLPQIQIDHMIIVFLKDSVEIVGQDTYLIIVGVDDIVNGGLGGAVEIFQSVVDLVLQGEDQIIGSGLVVIGIILSVQILERDEAVFAAVQHHDAVVVHIFDHILGNKILGGGGQAVYVQAGAQSVQIDQGGPDRSVFLSDFTDPV